MVSTHEQERTEDLERKARQADSNVRAIFLKLDEVRDEIFGRLDERFGQVDRRFEQMDEQFGRLTTTFEERCDEIGLAGGRIEVRLQDLKGDLETLDMRHDFTRRDARGTEHQIVDVRKVLAVHGERLDTMDGKLDTIIRVVGGGPAEES